MTKFDRDALFSAAESMSDADVNALMVALRAEMFRRALERADVDALVEDMFSVGFAKDGLAKDPELKDGLLVCAGGKVESSHLSHRCAFVRVADGWVWEHAEAVADVVRYGAGPRREMRSVTVVPVCEGDAVDLIRCRTRNGVHALVGVRSFVVGSDGLELVSSRSVSRTDHR